MTKRMSGKDQTHTGYTARHERLLRKHARPGVPSPIENAATGARDRFVITNTSTTSYPLSYVPIDSTVNLFLNGLALDEGIDHTVDYTVPEFVLTTSATRANGDTLWARYLTSDATAAQIQTTLTWGIRSDTATTIAAVDAVALIDPGTAFTDISAHLDPGSGEIVLVFGATPLPLDDSDGEYLFLRVGSSPGLWHFTRVATVDTDTLITSIGALTGAANYQVTVSGTTLTTKKNGTTVDTTVLTGSDAAALANNLVGLRGQHGVGIAATNFSADAGAVTDAFSRPDADQLGRADTGQNWIGAL